MIETDVVIVGAGLAGLSCAAELVAGGTKVLILEGRSVVGGRTSSWVQEGMPVESGLHRVLGFYSAFPDLLRRAGVDVNDIVYWEDEAEIRLPDGRGDGVFGAAPLFRPFQSLLGILGNFRLLSLTHPLSAPRFSSAGLLEYFTNPAALDQVSVTEKARAC